MKGFWGWVAISGSPEDKARLSHLDPDKDLHSANSFIWDNAALAGRGWEGSATEAKDGLLVSLAGRPRWEGGKHAEPIEILRAYQKWGQALLQELKGAFALALLHPDRQTALLAVDRFGVWDIAYTSTPQGFIFSPHPNLVASDPRCGANLDPQGLYDYLYFHVIPRPWTPFQGIFRLRPGEMVLFQEGETVTTPYWRPRFQEDFEIPVDQMEEHFRNTLRQAVARAAQPGPTGTFLSGGTDSSTITGMLGEVTGEGPKTFSIGFDAKGYDETGFARIAATRFGSHHHEYFLTPRDVAEAIPRIAAAYGQPYGNASVVPSFFCARLAQEAGIRVLLGGDGGDELFAGNARYSRQWLLGLYEHLPPSLRRGLLEPAVSLPGADKLPVARKLASYIRQASKPFPERLQTYNLLEHLGPDRVFTADFLASVDRERPLREISREYQDFKNASLVNRLLGVDMKFTLADDDLRKVTRAGELAGVETRFPFLDDELVSFAASIPANLKLRRTRLRYFFKRALREYLPKEILAKEKHGFGLPFGVWLRTEPALRELARDSLDGLRNRGIIRPGMIDELTRARLEEHPGYFGTLTWVLMMMEQWFRSDSR